MRDLLERRVPQYFAAYLGGGWVLIEFVSFLEERYAISPAWTDVSLLVLALMIPSFLLFTYNHGRPGRDRWTRSELIGIPLNLLLLAVVVTTAFSSRDLGATVRQITLIDEDGQVIERTVARDEFRKRVGLFNFDAAQGDSAVAWLGDGLPLLLLEDLLQDLFVDAHHPLQFRAQLREAGIPDGRAAPLALQRKLAEEAHLPYFLGGSVSRANGEYSVRAVVYETESGSPVREIALSGAELMPLVDELSVEVKQALELPRTRQGLVMDLPVAELLSASPEAARLFAQGISAMGRDDWSTGERLMLQATELDPGFAAAHYRLYLARTFQGNSQGGLPALQAAMQNLYRLPERTQLVIKTESFLANQDMDKAFAVTGLMTEMYPSDITGHQVRSQLQLYRGDRAGAVASLQRIVELDPQQHERLLEIAQMQEQMGQPAEALKTYEDYAARFPQNTLVLRRMAATLQRVGRLDDARAALDRAVLLDPTDHEVLLDLAMMLRSAGELDEAKRRLDAVVAGARTAEERVRAYAALQGYHSFRGQMTKAIAAGEQRFTAMSAVSPPMLVAAQRMGGLGMYVRAGQRARAESIMEQLRHEMRGSVDGFWRIGQLELAKATRDTVQLPAAMDGARALISEFGMKVLESGVVHGEAVLAEERRDWNGALKAFQQFREMEPTRVDILRDIARSYRMLNRLDDAQRSIDEHLRSVPASPESNIEAARIKLARGDTVGARAHLQRAATVLADADAAYEPAQELRALTSQLQTR